MRYTWAAGIAFVSAAVAVSSCGKPGETVGTSGTTSNGGGASGPGGNGTGGKGDGGDVMVFQDAGPDSTTCAGALTCADHGANCGTVPDGCGGTLDCGTCTQPQVCGGAGQPNVCGEPQCTAKTCADQNIQCGPAGDGCGKQIDCGGCPDPADSCGGGGTPSVCGHTTTCVPKTAADCPSLGINCGPAGDGCGGSIDCGSTCPAGQTCGGGGVAGVCGAPPCVPKTCADLGANCGPVSDGCGGLIASCGTCNAPTICGGGGTPSVCGVSASCTNLCLQQTTCSNPNVTTTITGKVYAPNGTDPLMNALVYVPNGTVQPFTPGVSCDNCGAAASGSPLVSAYSAVDGTFTITNAPVGANIPLVIQLGRWRRQITIPNVAACTNNALPATSTRLPRNKSEGDIPLMAFATGSVDALECVWRKIGIADSEFTGPNGNGRIHIYTGSKSGGATISGAQSETTLAGTAANLNRYDMVLFPCQGTPGGGRTATELANLLQYVNAGGRVFATHYSYVWLATNAPLSSTANWAPDQNNIWDDPNTGFIDMTFPKGQALAQWMMNVGASTTLGQIQINTLRNDFTGVVPPSQLWVTVNDSWYGNTPMHYTFNTPVGVPAAQQCGRVVYSDFHVEDAYTSGYTFPGECAAGAMTPQEKMLEFMLFDLASCVTADVPTCTPKTCSELGIGCGPSGDGCGNVIDCGTCPAGQTCGGGGVPSQCGAPTCTPKTCAQLGINCGPAGDGCGNLIQCGTCPAGQTCGGGGSPGVCGSSTCTARTCAQLGINCGPAGDGCGGLLQCGTCPSGQTCGGGGTPGVCGAPPCTPKTCVQLNAQCGVVADGCGNVLQCGSCPVGQSCNANNQCTIIG